MIERNPIAITNIQIELQSMESKIKRLEESLNKFDKGSKVYELTLRVLEGNKKYCLDLKQQLKDLLKD